MTQSDAELLLHNAEVLMNRAIHAVDTGNETQAAKLAKCAAVLVKLARKHSKEREAK